MQTHSTNPLLSAGTIDAAVAAFAAAWPVHHDSLFSVSAVRTRLFDQLGRAVNHNPAMLMRTQDLPPLWEENSLLYIFKAQDLFQSHTRIGKRPLMFETPPCESHDIDTPADWDMVAALMAARRPAGPDAGAPSEEVLSPQHRPLPMPIAALRPVGGITTGAQQLTVLVSAPYILPHMAARFSELLSSFNLRVLCPHGLHERLSEDELLAIAGSFDATICGDDAYTARVLAACSPRLKVIAKWGTGIDSIDKVYAQSIGVAVTNTLGAFTDPVADSTLAYMLLFARNVAATDADMKAGSWVKLPGKTLRECTVGLVGCGNIGQAVCARLRGFGACVLFVDPVAPPPAFMEANRHVSAAATLADMLPQCDFVCLCCDLNPSSKHIINATTLACMRPDAVLINTARGPLVDEAALVASLESGSIAGAAMDVFEHEPLAKHSPLLSIRNVVLAPHNANASPACHEAVHWKTIKSMLSALAIPFEEVPLKGA